MHVRKKFQEHLYNAKILRKVSSCKYHGKVQRMRETVYIRDIRDDDGEELISRKRIKRATTRGRRWRKDQGTQ